MIPLPPGRYVLQLGGEPSAWFVVSKLFTIYAHDFRCQCGYVVVIYKLSVREILVMCCTAPRLPEDLRFNLFVFLILRDDVTKLHRAGSATDVTVKLKVLTSPWYLGNQSDRRTWGPHKDIKIGCP